MIFNPDSIYTEEELKQIKECREKYHSLLKASFETFQEAVKENGGDLTITDENRNRVLPNGKQIGYLGALLVALEEPGRQRYYKAHNTVESLNAEVTRIIADITEDDLNNSNIGDTVHFPRIDENMDKESVYYRRCLIVVGLQIEALKHFVDTKQFDDKDGQAFTDNFNKAAEKKLKELLPDTNTNKARTKAEEELAKEDLPVVNETGKIIPAEVTNESFSLLNIVKPLSYTVLNSTISNNYLAIEDNLLRLNTDGQFAFIPEAYPVSVGDKTRPVTTLVSLSYEGELSGRLSLLKGYDNTVLNAICSLIQAGNRMFTINDIYRTLTGNSKKDPQPKQKEMIKASMLKLSQTRITIDRTEEARNKMLTDEEGNRVTSLKIRDTLISYREADVKTENGRVITAIEIKSEPPLLQYARDKRQLISFPTSLLCFNSISSTQDNIVISEYLVKQIVQFAKGKRNNPVILFDSICRATSISTDKNKTEFKRFRDTVYKILDELIKKPEIELYKLKGYEERKEGHTIIGVKLIFAK